MYHSFSVTLKALLKFLHHLKLCQILHWDQNGHFHNMSELRIVSKSQVTIQPSNSWFDLQKKKSQTWVHVIGLGSSSVWSISNLIKIYFCFSLEVLSSQQDLSINLTSSGLQKYPSMVWVKFVQWDI